MPPESSPSTALGTHAKPHSLDPEVQAMHLRPDTSGGFTTSAHTIVVLSLVLRVLANTCASAIAFGGGCKCSPGGRGVGCLVCGGSVLKCLAQVTLRCVAWSGVVWGAGGCLCAWGCLTPKWPQLWASPLTPQPPLRAASSTRMPGGAQVSLSLGCPCLLPAPQRLRRAVWEKVHTGAGAAAFQRRSHVIVGGGIATASATASALGLCGCS